MNYSSQQEVHAPYHFVPLSKWVYMPEWAHLVSHDHPFEDGYSGVIDYILTNVTPLCVGGEQVQRIGQPALVKWAKDPQGNPVIPGSSMKGMLRSVLEIVSFSKLSAVDESQLFYRDFTNSNYKSILNDNEVQACWLKFDAQKSMWTLRKCRHTKLFHDEFNDFKKLNINNSQHGYNAISSYKKFDLNQLISFDEEKRKFKIDSGNDLDTLRAINFGHKKKHEGYVIFSSYRPLVPIKDKNNNFVKAEDKTDSDKRTVKDRTNFSYIFYDEEKEVQNVHTKIVNSFFSAHQNEIKVREKKVKVIDYYIEKQNNELGIPVFALLSKVGNQFDSLGLAKMPRVSYKYSIGDLVKGQNKANQADSCFDMAELIFGTLRDEGLSLKSRVAFTDATTSDSTKNSLYESNSLVLNGAKPTFYPAYLEQNPKLSKDKKFNDYDDKTAPAGRKRYINKEPKFDKLTQSDLSDKSNVSSKMELAPVDSEFSGKIVFHNLKAEELGALLWVIQLGGNRDSYHSLGHGKPYGAGAVQLTSNLMILKCNKESSASFDENEFMNKFTEKMENAYPFDGQWSNSPQIKYLHALANMQANYDVDTRYMSIDNKDYQNAKNSGAILEPFNNLERTDSNYEEFCVSPAFGKGRLSHLLNEGSRWDKKQIERQSKSLIKAQESNLSPYEKNKSLLSLIVKAQDSLTKTDLKNKAKDLRFIFKELKELTLTQQEANTLLDIYSQITVSKKETDKAIKYLRKKLDE